MNFNAGPFRLIKVAWIRNPGIPPGQPAPGRLDCPCGQAPESNHNQSQPDIVCGCGTVYRWDGTIIQRDEG